MTEEVDPREGLWNPDAPAASRGATGRDSADGGQPVPRKRALPRSRVSLTLWLLVALVIVAGIVGTLL